MLTIQFLPGERNDNRNISQMKIMTFFFKVISISLTSSLTFNDLLEKQKKFPDFSRFSLTFQVSGKPDWVVTFCPSKNMPSIMSD